MIRIFSLILLLVSCSARKKDKTDEPTFTFSGTVTQTSSYCGGARPSEETVQEYNKPKPYAGKVLHVRLGADNNAGGKVVLKLVADSAGFFSGSLPAGSYCIVQEEQLKPLDLSAISGKGDTPVNIDTICIRKWWNGRLAEIDLTSKNVSGLSVNFHHPCFVSGDVPCRRYSGPMPQ
jgi:hypothetical protein